MSTNLPIEIKEDSAAGTKLYFDNYGEDPLEFPANDVAVTIAYFKGAGFDEDAALVTAMTLLRQAKLDGTPIYEILDTLKGLKDLDLSQLVGEILNNNRVSTSTLGFRVANVVPTQSRNIAA
jgi:hypothetical protein